MDDAARTVNNALFAIVRADAAGARADDDPGAEIIDDYYDSCMSAPSDQSTREELTPLLAAISVATPEAVAQQVAQQWSIGSTALFSTGTGVDDADPTRAILVLDQGGVGLRNRADYLDPDREALREGYRQFIVELSGFFDATAIDAKRVVALETALAQAALEPNERIDRGALYHPMKLAELCTLAPHFPWTSYFEALQSPGRRGAFADEPEVLQRARRSARPHASVGLASLPGLALDPAGSSLARHRRRQRERRVLEATLRRRDRNVVAQARTLSTTSTSCNATPEPVADNPAQWLPWTYRATLARLTELAPSRVGPSVAATALRCAQLLPRRYAHSRALPTATCRRTTYAKPATGPDSIDTGQPRPPPHASAAMRRHHELAQSAQAHAPLSEGHRRTPNYENQNECFAGTTPTTAQARGTFLRYLSAPQQ